MINEELINHVTLTAALEVVLKMGGKQEVEKYLRDELELIPRRYLIDSDALPIIPKGYTLASHKKSGKLKFSKETLGLFLSAAQEDDEFEVGTDLKKLLSQQPVLNANFMHFLLQNKHAIPDIVKSIKLFFWGTTFFDAHGYEYVSYIFWNGKDFDSDERWVNSRYGKSSAGAILKPEM